MPLSMSDPSQGRAWLDRFHAGDRSVMEGCYREQFDTVDRAVGSVLRGADRETVVHEVFYRLLSSRSLRDNFAGGSLAGWISRVAKNQAIDYQRRAARERPVDPAKSSAMADEAVPSFEQRLGARLAVERFRRELLPAEWTGVFEKRFMEQLSQREAAAALGIRRTTLAYREARIRRLLRRFLLRNFDLDGGGEDD